MPALLFLLLRPATFIFLVQSTTLALDFALLRTRFLQNVEYLRCDSFGSIFYLDHELHHAHDLPSLKKRMMVHSSFQTFQKHFAGTMNVGYAGNENIRTGQRALRTARLLSFGQHGGNTARRTKLTTRGVLDWRQQMPVNATRFDKIYWLIRDLVEILDLVQEPLGVVPGLLKLEALQTHEAFFNGEIQVLSDFNRMSFGMLDGRGELGDPGDPVVGGEKIGEARTLAMLAEEEGWEPSTSRSTGREPGSPDKGDVCGPDDTWQDRGNFWSLAKNPCKFFQARGFPVQKVPKITRTWHVGLERLGRPWNRGSGGIGSRTCG